MATKTVTIKDTQTLFDLSLQLYGSVENVFDLMKLNPQIEDVHQQLLAGVELTYEEQLTDIPVYFSDKEITIATNYPIVMDVRSFDDSFELSFR